MLETFETLDRAAIGKRITEGRKHIKMRRETLAEKLDVSVQFIADVEYGKKGMSMKTFYSICQALDITPNYLLAGSRYSFTGSEEYTRVCEEIAFLLKDCDDNIGVYFSVDELSELKSWSSSFSSVVRKGYLTGYRPLDKRYGFVLNTVFKHLDKSCMCQIIEIRFK